jgi:hypothetical protein
VQAFARDYPQLRAVVWYDRKYDERPDFDLEPLERFTLATALGADPHWDPGLHLTAVSGRARPSLVP